MSARTTAVPSAAKNAFVFVTVGLSVIGRTAFADPEADQAESTQFVEQRTCPATSRRAPSPTDAATTRFADHAPHTAASLVVRVARRCWYETVMFVGQDTVAIVAVPVDPEIEIVVVGASGLVIDRVATAVFDAENADVVCGVEHCTRPYVSNRPPSATVSVREAAFVVDGHAGIVEVCDVRTRMS